MRIQRRIEAAGLLAIVLLVGACGGEPQATAHWDEVGIEDADAEQIALAVQARDAFASRLIGELTGAIADGGPGNAVGICNVEAPLIASSINTEFGVQIGRTSYKLRNPENAPPGWMSSVVTEKRAEPTAFVGPDGSLGAVYPIRLAATCLLCHGEPETIIPEAKARIAEHYPDDRATGFAAGDLRGWFWIVVPEQ